VNYDLTGLFAKPPSERLIIPFDNPNYPVLFIARWPGEFFDSHGAFVRFTEMYDSAMQGFVQGMARDDLSEWFVPHEELDVHAPPVAVTPSRTEDAVDWMARNFPFAEIPWLRRGDHTEIIDEYEGEFGGLTAYGDAGYLNVFVADLL
jgi:hypothetical protein